MQMCQLMENHSKATPTKPATAKEKEAIQGKVDKKMLPADQSAGSITSATLSFGYGQTSPLIPFAR